MGLRSGSVDGFVSRISEVSQLTHILSNLRITLYELMTKFAYDPVGNLQMFLRFCRKLPRNHNRCGELLLLVSVCVPCVHIMCVIVNLALIASA